MGTEKGTVMDGWLGTSWGCYDCAHLEANGEVPEDMGGAAVADFIGRVEAVEAREKCNWTMGRIHGVDDCGDDHGDDYEAIDRCESIDFAWRKCDLCDSGLGGSRWAFTAWALVTR